MKTRDWVICGISVVAMSNCSSRKESGDAVETMAAALTAPCASGQPCTLTIPVPQGLTPQDVVLTATSQLKIDDRAQVRTTTGFGTIAGLGTGGVETGVSSRVGNIWSAGPVLLRNNALVNGSIRAAGTVTRQAGAMVTGSTTTQPVPTDNSRQVTVTFPTGVTSITLQPDQSQTLSPGAYGAVVVNSRATLSLSAGIYQLTSLQVEPQGNLRLDQAGGPVIIYVQSTLLFKGNQVQLNGDGRVFVGVFGTQAVSLQAPFRGTVVAPNAALHLTTQSAGFAGAFIGSTLELFPDTTVTGIGAVIPEQPGTGVSPTLNCVARLNSTTFGAVFGYTNTTGANVKVGVGPNNRFSPGETDRGQPILFVPGQVPIASFQTFAAGSQLFYTIGQQTVVASATSRACSAALSGTLIQLFVDNANTNAVRAQAQAFLSNPLYRNWINTSRTTLAARLSPYQRSLLDAALLVADNADLLGDPAGLSAAQRARIPGFRASLLGNAAVNQLRLSGDALRAGATTGSCAAITAINDNQAWRPVQPLSPQVGSLFAQAVAVSQSSAVAAVQNTVANIARGPQAGALLGAPGLILAGFQPLTQLRDLELSGAVPTGFLSVVAGVVGGAVMGAGVGLATGNPYGVVVGAVIGGIIGGAICANSEETCDTLFGGGCTSCTGGASDAARCGEREDPNSPLPICVDGCCSDTDVPTITGSFLRGVSCPNAAARCQRDFDCGAGNVCVQNCCLNPQAFAGQCAGANSCSVDAACNRGNSCLHGCCVGPCGFNILTCSIADAPDVCQDEGPGICLPGQTCSAGCCGIVIP